MGNIKELAIPEILVLPKDPYIEGLLEEKVVEYHDRLSEKQAKNPHLSSKQIANSFTGLKAIISERLHYKGEVNLTELLRELVQQYGDVDLWLYANAGAVINDYITTGGKNLTQGKGF